MDWLSAGGGERTPHTDEHRDWVDAALRTGTCVEASVKYLPERLLAVRLANEPDPSCPLRLLLREHSIDLSLAPAIAANHYKVFAILLAIGRPKYIAKFIREGLEDQRLPFEDRDKWATVPIDDESYDRFHAAQWTYCVRRLECNRLLDRDFHRLEILPFQRSATPIGRGGSANIYTVNVDPDYDGLTEPPDEHKLVLKSYYTSEAANERRTESVAYRRINPQDGILRYFGDFKQGDAHHILLEYADRGTLEDMFMDYEGPRRKDEVMAFWTQVLQLPNALAYIHVPPEDYMAQEYEHTRGWHQDLEPRNILGCRNNSSTIALAPYNWLLKIGDLGCSHFKTYGQAYVELQRKLQDDDIPGSRSYGAPEVYRSANTDSLRIPVSNKVDIFSLGAIFAESVVYVVEGRAGLQRFRKERHDETGELPGFQDKGCFHDGHQTLKCVSQMLDRIELGSDLLPDSVTSRVIQVTRDMMGLEDMRPDARALTLKCQTILNDARHKSLAQNAASNPTSPHLPTPPLPPGTPPTRPTLISDLARLDGGASAHNQGRAQTEPMSGHIESYPGTHPSTGHYGHQASQPDGMSPVASLVSTRISGKARESNGSYTTNISPVNGPLLADRDLRRSPDEDPTSPYTLQSFPHSALPSRLPHTSYGPQISERHRSEGAGPSGEASFHGNMQENGSRLYHASSELQQNQVTPLNSANVGPSISMPEARSVHEQGRESVEHPEVGNEQGGQSALSADIQYYPIIDFVNWYKHTKELNRSTRKSLTKRVLGSGARVLPAGGKLSLLNCVRKREHIFLIDDAVSMGDYWSQVYDLIGAMTKLIKYLILDETGVDVYFASGREPLIGYRDATPLLDELSKMPRNSDAYDLPVTLETITNKYIKPLHSRRESNGMSVYILTDGRWRAQSDARLYVRRLVEALERTTQPNNVGLQFVRFGNDELGGSRLATLDTLKLLENLDRDVVDTTDYDNGRGNVFKIMIGMTDTTYDGDWAQRGEGPSSRGVQ